MKIDQTLKIGKTIFLIGLMNYYVCLMDVFVTGRSSDPACIIVEQIVIS